MMAARIAMYRLKMQMYLIKSLPFGADFSGGFCVQAVTGCLGSSFDHLGKIIYRLV
jgi:hypothetical protein